MTRFVSHFSISKITIFGLLIALGVSLGYLLAAIPNIELITTTVFISGFITGPLPGILIGAMTIGLYSLLNPYGIAPPPLFLAQVLCYAVIGFSAGHLSRHIRRINWKHSLLFGFLGLFFTVLYAVLTTLAYVLTAGNETVLIWGSLIQGLHFYAVHMVSNTLFFVFLIPVTLNRLGEIGWLKEKSFQNLSENNH